MSGHQPGDTCPACGADDIGLERLVVSAGGGGRRERQRLVCPACGEQQAADGRFV